jgi:hypothetical protein
MLVDHAVCLGPATNADVLAFILSKNQVATSENEQPADVERLKGMAALQVTPEIRAPRGASSVLWPFELREKLA